MEHTKILEVPAPKFDLYELVTLYWNNREQPTRIVQRWLNIDESDQGGWWYKVAEDEQLYPESVFAPRDD
ncbi:MAG: hypothetical protein HC769_36505 [Cyanobacteria bacterium CRU_2_1]|nr:hypothetical protein [Cyanobacteria bacterium CRU_2_1]